MSRSGRRGVARSVGPWRARTTRRGIVLFAALALLALLGLLLAGAASYMVLAGRAGKLAELDARLDAAAELAANTVLAEPMAFGVSELSFGIANTFDIAATSDIQATVSVTRLRDDIVWIVGEARSGAGTAGPSNGRGDRRVSVIARIPRIAPMPAAGLIARGSVVTGASVVFATDTIGDPDCRVSSGAPRTAMASDSAAYLLTRAQLARVDSAPNTIHARHDTTLGPGSFTGIIVADSAISIVGPFDMTGLIVARCAVVVHSGVSLLGAAMSYDSSGHPAIRVDSSIVRYSPCAVARELRRLLPPRRIRSRSWLEVF